MRAEVLTQELKSAKGDVEKETTLKAAIAQIEQQQNKLMAIIEKVKLNEKNEYLRKMLGLE